MAVAALPDRRRVLNAAGAPELIQPARNSELRSGTEIALVEFAVISDMADDAHGPILCQPEPFAICAFSAHQPHHVRLLRFQRLVDVLEVTPSSSALIIAYKVHFTIIIQSSSRCRTTGASGSLEMTSGRMTWSPGLVRLSRNA